MNHYASSKKIQIWSFQNFCLTGQFYPYRKTFSIVGAWWKLIWVDNNDDQYRAVVSLILCYFFVTVVHIQKYATSSTSKAHFYIYMLWGGDRLLAPVWLKRIQKDTKYLSSDLRMTPASYQGWPPVLNVFGLIKHDQFILIRQIKVTCFRTSGMEFSNSGYTCILNGFKNHFWHLSHTDL